MADKNDDLQQESLQLDAAMMQQSAKDQEAALSAELDTFEEFLVRGENEVTGVELAPEFNGETITNPINKSPLSTEDRFKLSFSDEKGKEQFLRDRYDDVEKTSDGWLVQEGGRWYRTDKKGLSKNAWDATSQFIASGATYAAAGLVGLAEAAPALATGGDVKTPTMNNMLKALQQDTLSKEVISDIADVSKEIGIGGASAGAALATGGASLVAQAGALMATGGAASIAASSFGKLQGTYQGDAGEQIGEAAVEAMLNVAGVMIPAGGSKVLSSVKNTRMADFMSGQLKRAQPFFKQAAKQAARSGSGALEVFADLVGAASKIDSAQAYRYMARPEAITGTLDRAIKVSAGQGDDAVQAVLERKMQQTTLGLAKRTRRALTNMYDDMAGRIVEAAPEGVILDGARPIKEVLDDFASKGLLNKTDEGYQIYSQSQLGMLAQNPKSELQSLLASDRDALNIFNEMASGLVGRSGQRASVGKAAVKTVLENEKNGIAMLENAYSRALNRGSSQFAQMIRPYQQSLRGNVTRQFESAIGGPQGKRIVEGIYDLRRSYATMAGSVENLLELNAKSGGLGRAATSQGVLAIADRESQALVSSMGKRAIKANSVGNAVQALQKYDRKLPQLMDNLFDQATAKSFVPKVRTQFVQFGPVAAISGGLLGASASQDGAGAAGGAVVGLGLLTAATSPRFFYQGLRALSKTQGAAGTAVKGVSQASANGMLAVRGLIGFMDDKARLDLFSTPGAMNALTQVALRAPMARAAMEEQLQSAAPEPQTGREVASTEDTISFDSDANGSTLGEISRQFEVGPQGGVATISSGKDDPGGKSYGQYQLASKIGTLKKYINSSSEFGGEFKGMELGSKEFDKKWREIATDPERAEQFAADQENFIVESHYKPALNKLAKAGIDVESMSLPVQQLLFSTSVQYGSVVSIFKRAHKEGMSERELINRVQDIKLTRFKSGSKLKKRIQQERKKLLEALAER